MDKVILILYAIPLVFIFTYSLGQLNLVYLYVRQQNKSKPSVLPLSNDDLPIVTIQLPIYNKL